MKSNCMIWTGKRVRDIFIAMFKGENQMKYTWVFS